VVEEAMVLGRRGVMTGLLAGGALVAGRPLAAASPQAVTPAVAVIRGWMRLVLELIRHTPTYSPPVASRALGYLCTALWEAQVPAAGPTLAGRLNGLGPLPPRAAGLGDAAVLQGALATLVPALFANTGPSGQRALQAMAARMESRAVEGDPRGAEGLAQGRVLGAAILDWAATDGGAMVENLGFPDDWPPAESAAEWVPTSPIRLQQTPLLPAWGQNRPFALAGADLCGLPPPPDYSENPGSAFHAEALEVYETSRNLTPEQAAIARFWSDDAMLSPTPPGHWIAIALTCLQETGADAARHAQVLAPLGIAMADAFIVCWKAKYDYDLLRPVTYIRRVIDPAWEPLLITPPFPEYPSGHSTVSGAAQTVMTALLGEAFAFADATHQDDGLPIRPFASFAEAAREAALSRLYGGIHFRSAIENGLSQGTCVGEAALRLGFAG
jgi:membrane-associated phospholipid phosphatase